jgi:serine/threonine-protein kinase
MTSFADHLQDALGTGYELERELLGGGMSRVFVAKDRALGRTIVVKVLPPDLAAGVNRERFRREIQLAAQLQHPHIVPLLSAGESGELLWYTMPYIDGESLRAMIERKKPFTPREVARILHDVLDALAHAHKRGIVHRDIKPANILTQGSHALVADFGVAKALSAALPGAGVGVTTAGMAIGTPSYMAPEQLAGDPTADHRIDLYAVGLLAYELLSGESPFAGPSPRETMAAQLTRDPKPLHEVNPAVPPAMSALIMRLLAKDPEMRPANAEAVLEELDGMTITAGPSTPVSGGVMAPVAVATRSLTMVFAGIGVLTVAFIGWLLIVRPNAEVRAQRRAMQEAQRDSIRKFNDSVAKVAQISLAGPPVLSHADSMKIADNVNKALRQARIRDSVSRARLRDSLQAVEEKRARDSIFKAYGAKTSAASRRRIVVVEPRPSSRWPELEQVGRAVADSLRAMLAKRSYIIVNPDSVRTQRLTYNTVPELAANLSSELLVSIKIDERPPRRGQAGPDSVLLRITAYDLTARSQYSQRTLPAALSWTVHEEILGNLEAILLQTVGALEEMSRAPRRTSNDPNSATGASVTMPDGRVIRIPMTIPLDRGAFQIPGQGTDRVRSPIVQPTSPATSTAPKKPPV